MIAFSGRYIVRVFIACLSLLGRYIVRVFIAYDSLGKVVLDLLPLAR